MFTGIVETIGRIMRHDPAPDGVSVKMTVSAPFSGDLAIGESVALNGICLTVIEHRAQTFDVEATVTTQSLTTLGTWSVGSPVNLERSVTPTTRLGGHWVLGHIDTTGTIVGIAESGDANQVTINYPSEFVDLVLPLGSITIDGASLTVVSCHESCFTVTLIPHTQAVTTLGEWRTGNAVNLEFDVLGKYVKHLLRGNGESTWLQKN
jgi:riboflavin synthase